MSLKHSEVEPIKEIRKTLNQFREVSLALDPEGRSRCFLAPFSSLTSRNQPSTSKFIFGFAKWFRFLIKPEVGKAIAYLDWSQQEFGIAAALSGDRAMIEAYRSGDPYMAFAIQAKAAPEGATKESHSQVRALYKQCILAVQYGMGAHQLAQKLGIRFPEAKELLRMHKKVYSGYWKWLESAEAHAMLTSQMKTRFGWTFGITPETKRTTIRNFHMQANGAEMIRFACVFAHEMGIKVCAPIHDAILIESDTDKIDEAVAKTKLAMRKASEMILPGFALESDVKIFRFPERFVEKDAIDLWSIISSKLIDLQSRVELKIDMNVVDCRPSAQSLSFNEGGSSL